MMQKSAHMKSDLLQLFSRRGKEFVYENDEKIS